MVRDRDSVMSRIWGYVKDVKLFMRLGRDVGEASPSLPPPSGEPLPTGPGLAYVKLVRAHLVHEATLSPHVLYKQECL